MRTLIGWQQHRETARGECFEAAYRNGRKDRSSCSRIIGVVTAVVGPIITVAVDGDGDGGCGSVTRGLV